MPPIIRKLCTHFKLYPNRLDRASIPYISKGVMLHKDTLRQLFDACVEPYDFLLINQRSHSRNYHRCKAQRAARRLRERRLDRAGVTIVPDSMGQVTRAQTVHRRRLHFVDWISRGGNRGV